MRPLLPSLFLVSLLAPAVPAAPAGFNRDIRPILADACYHCHGPDPASRKEDLRLDREEGLFGPRTNGPMVVRGRPEESPLYQRLVTPDPDEIMPPPSAHKELTPAQKESIRRWIAEGAPWEPHWSFIPPRAVEPPTPAADPAFPLRNPIDAFVLDRLRQAGLSPAPEADRRTLARRVALDLTGLPPAPAEVEAFLADASPQAYEAYVDRLLASPRYGEHRARYWLDVARYADTHGLHFDNYREMWPYRDWVIEAYNRNQPFDRFTVEQLAGDLLPNPTLAQRVATGFHRCNITTNEGGTIPEENLAGYARDRVSTTAWAWLGLTANCAECHDHKFDPISMRDFYAMAAFFRNTTQGALDGNVKDSAPSLRVPAREDFARWEALPGEIEAAQRDLAERERAAEPAFAAWLAGAKEEDLRLALPTQGLVVHLPLDEGSGAAARDAVAPPSERRMEGPLVWLPGGPLGPALQFHSGAQIDLGAAGDYSRQQSFSYGAWVKATDAQRSGAPLARMDNGKAYRGWDLFQSGDRWSMHLIDAWEGNALKVQTKDPSVRTDAWQHVFVTYDGSGKARGVRLFIDGVEQAAVAVVDRLSGRADVRTPVPLRVGSRTGGDAFSGFIQDVRVYERKLEPAEVRALAGRVELPKALALVRTAAAPEAGADLAGFFAELPRQGLVVHAPLHAGAGRQTRDADQPDRTYSAGADPAWVEGGPLGDAAVIRPGATFDLGAAGDFDKDQAFSYGAWVRFPGGQAHQAILARMDDQKDFRGWDLFQHDRRVAVHIIHRWPSDGLKVQTRAEVVRPGTWQHVLVTYDGSGAAKGVQIHLDGQPVPLEITHNSLRNSIRTETPLRVGQRSTGQHFVGGQVQDVRVYDRKLDSPEVARLAAARPDLSRQVSPARVAAARRTLREYHLATLDRPTAEARAKLAALEAERTVLDGRSAITHVQQEKMNSKPMAKVLRRGQYDDPIEDVGAATFAALPPMPAGAPTNRLGLAEWLVMPENPLTARVTVNRLWQEVFGVGIVKTAEDFGIVGDKPSHPELLDWLAVEFLRGGWDVKRLLRLIVTSSTYRQAQTVTPEKWERDPENRLFSRGPRFRLDAEVIRDQALAVSGLLSPRIGGPSARPYQPDGVWEAVAMPESNTKRYQADTGENLYRRSLYTFWKRSAPPASMDIFNAPSRETSCLRRERTNTPLQALVTLNDPQFVEAARKLAESALGAAADPEATLQEIARRCLLRPLRAEESAELLGGLRDLLAYYQAQPAQAQALLGVGESPADPPQPPAPLAAWTLVASQMLNLDEFLNK
jgi:hypothetical protein